MHFVAPWFVGMLCGIGVLLLMGGEITPGFILIMGIVCGTGILFSDLIAVRYFNER